MEAWKNLQNRSDNKSPIVLNTRIYLIVTVEFYTWMAFGEKRIAQNAFF